ncbi:UPF0481 protein At3g47200-like [Magnolia sinica]|uniref:UPF0481 protein At3g47200-like n=1 Tax=Magnolia sinica TaxID=86752 RepID=UPI00265AC898|nr:UPF0481 protein At3g47200-like [Magnolia sinica]
MEEGSNLFKHVNVFKKLVYKGGICKGATGDFLFTFTAAYGFDSNTRAVYNSLADCRAMGFVNVDVESDFILVVRLLNGYLKSSWSWMYWTQTIDKLSVGGLVMLMKGAEEEHRLAPFHLVREVLKGSVTVSLELLLFPDRPFDGSFPSTAGGHPTEVGCQKNKAISSTSPTANSENEKHTEESSYTGPAANMGNFIISIKNGLDRCSEIVSQVDWSSYSICKVPRKLREIDPKAYTPQVISIGPIHKGADHLQYMELYKWYFLRSNLDRTKHDLELYINAILKLVDRTRKFYGWSSINLNDQDLIMMLLLDSSFIIELLLMWTQGLTGNEGNLLYTDRVLLPSIQSDMLLFENQIPLFVLDSLFPIIVGPYYKGDSVSQLALGFFNSAIPGRIKNQGTPNTGNKDVDGRHLLDVIRQSLIPLRSTPPMSTPSSSSSQPTDALVDHRHPHLMIQCVSMLSNSGVKFKKKMLSKLTDIEFKGGVLEIPPLVVDDHTKPIFLNLMAVEQCHREYSDEISSYIVFMDGLINSSRDVAYLQQKGIINHWLGSDEAVAQLFNDLCREISIDDINGSYLSILSTQLNDHVSRKWPTWRAILKREYFGHPWSTISVIAAVLVIILTLIQAFYAILAYHAGPS